jgi:uncharacterized membrane protein (Fun14 family)
LVLEEAGMDLLTPMIVQLGFGGVAGLAVGYAVKKLLKLVVLLIGVFFLGLAYLKYIGLIEIHFDKLSEAFNQLAEKILGGGLVLPNILSTNLPAVGGFAAGFVLGFKKG